MAAKDSIRRSGISGEPCSAASVAEHDARDQARGDGDQHIVGPHLHPLLTTRGAVQAVHAVVRHDILAVAELARDVAAAPEFRAARAVVLTAVVATRIGLVETRFIAAFYTALIANLVTLAGLAGGLLLHPRGRFACAA